ncbi:hypothetical protein [Listeria fleischmannii]|uniref:primosomal protein N' family DNA-binding protein n=1 Tax=Listeria fleischmannii TaxID=1069827 RepID=UPI0003A6EDC1
MNQVAKVIVDVPAMQVDRPFDYVVPENLVGIALVGTRVSVPFGNRKVQGFVVELGEVEDVTKLKTIDSVMDVLPVLNEELLELGDFLAKETLAFRVSVYQAMLPAALRAKYEKYVVRLDTEDDELERLFEGYETLPFKELVGRNILKKRSKICAQWAS